MKYFKITISIIILFILIKIVPIYFFYFSFKNTLNTSIANLEFSNNQQIREVIESLAKDHGIIKEKMHISINSGIDYKLVKINYNEDINIEILNKIYSLTNLRFKYNKKIRY